MAYWLDDNWENGRMLRLAGTAAFGLYCACGLWVARNTSDGFVPADVAAAYGTREWAGKLVAAGLWEAVEGGFQDLHYLVLNPSAEKVEQRRQAKAERQQRWLEKQKKQRRVSRRSHDASKDASVDAVKDVAPTQPPSKEGLGGERPRSAHGASLAPTADAWDEDPRALQEHDDEMRERAESAVRSIAEEQARRRRGAAAARAALRAPTRERPA